jgi:hypothetical protein
VEGVVDEDASRAAALAGADGVEPSLVDPAFDRGAADPETGRCVALADRFGRAHVTFR